MDSPACAVPVGTSADVSAFCNVSDGVLADASPVAVCASAAVFEAAEELTDALLDSLAIVALADAIGDKLNTNTSENNTHAKFFRCFIATAPFTRVEKGGSLFNTRAN